MATNPTTTPTSTNPLSGIANAFTPNQGELMGRQSTLSEWVGPYVTDMLGKAKAMTEQPYQVYQGPLTAGTSALQEKAFQGIGGLTVPRGLGMAQGVAADVADEAAGLGYTPGQFGNQFAAPGAFQAGQFTPGFNYQAPTEATQFTNQFQGPGAFQAGTFQSGIFGTPQAQQYMNPFLQTALSPALDEMRRQAEISRTQQAGRLAQAGAFGGSRQAIMESELNRNLMESQRRAIGEGYMTAYDKAAAQYNADMARAMEAQRMGEQSRQFGAGQGMTAAQLQAQYGLSAQQAQEAARQFNAGQGLSAAQLQAQFGLDAQRAAEMSRQFGAQQAMTAAQQAAQYGTEAQRQAEQSRQFGASYGLQGLAQQLAAAQALGSLGQTAGAEQRANLQAMMGAGAQQRAIEQEGITADLNEFLQQRDYPMKQVQFLQSMLQGLPISTVSQQYNQPSGLSNFMGQSAGVLSILKDWFPDMFPKP